MTPALRRNRFTATRLTEGTLLGIGDVITDAWVQNPLPLELCFHGQIDEGIATV